MTQGVVASIFAQETRLRQMVDALQVKRVDEFFAVEFRIPRANIYQGEAWEN